MNTDDIVRTFLDFYRERGHEPITGSSLLPSPSDPVLFTTSGMHPLTPYLLGRPHPQGRRLVNVQRCLRTTDLDEVGDLTHLTVFDMLGSWSLGDYDHPQSLRWGYELLRDGFGIPREKLYVTVFGGDEQVGPILNRWVPGGSWGCRLSRRGTRTGGPTGPWGPVGLTRRSSSGPGTGRRRGALPVIRGGWRSGITCTCGWSGVRMAGSFRCGR